MLEALEMDQRRGELRLFSFQIERTMSDKKFRLYNKGGRRKFLTAGERREFLDACHDAPAHERSLCLVLAYTGCQLVEALALTAANIDLAGDAILLSEDGQRWRGVPVPPSVIRSLDVIHGVRRSQQAKDGGKSAKLWPVDRTTAWRWVCRVMKKAGIEGPQAVPRGLRHGFAIDAIAEGVRLETVAQWMGHQDLEITKIYADTVRAEKSHHN